MTDAASTDADLTDDAIDRAVRNAWHPVARVQDVGERPLAVTLMDEPLVVARFPQGIRAFTDVCVHRGTAVSLGWMDDGCLVCPFHGWSYGADGGCVAIPSLGPDANIPARARLGVHHTREHLGLVWVCLGEPVAPLPTFPEFDDPAMRVVACPPYDWACNALRRTENFLDFAHFAWVHPGILGDRDHPEVPAHEVWRDGPTIRVRQPRSEPANPEKTAGLDLGIEPGGMVDSVMHYVVYPPLAAQLHQDLPAGRRYAVWLAASPVGPKACRTFWYVARNYDLDGDDTTYVRFQQDVVAQDRAIVESQRPERIPLQLRAELHVRDDKLSIEFRRYLLDLGALSQPPGPPGTNG